MKSRPAPSYWMIVRRDSHRIVVLTRVVGRESGLLVFGFEDEARAFLLAASLDDGWCLRESSAGELISVLLGPCAYVDGVILDPLPDISRLQTPRNVGRRRFVDFLIARQKLWLSARSGAQRSQGRTQVGAPGKTRGETRDGLVRGLESVGPHHPRLGKQGAGQLPRTARNVTLHSSRSRLSLLIPLGSGIHPRVFVLS